MPSVTVPGAHHHHHRDDTCLHVELIAEIIGDKILMIEKGDVLNEGAVRDCIPRDCSTSRTSR
jgi:hypothetical protein